MAAGLRGAEGNGRGAALCIADTASATAVTTRPAATVRRLRRTARCSNRLPRRPPARIGGNSGTAQLGGAYGSGTASAGEPAPDVRALAGDEEWGEGEEDGADERMGNTA